MKNAIVGLKRRLKKLKYFQKLLSTRRYNALVKGFDVNMIRLIFIEPYFNFCNLKCLYCPIGERIKLKEMSRGMMNVETLEKIWKKSLSNYQHNIGLYNWGEAFLNPELPAIVKFLKENAPGKLLLNSNFSWSHDDRVTEILSYLDNDIIIISCDGFSQEMCEKYRVGVDFSKVMHNIELINKRKKPQTELLWQYLDFPWNKEHFEPVRKYCKENGITFYTGKGIVEKYPQFPFPVTGNKDKFRCEFFLDALTINHDGSVYPCCAYYGPEKYSIGNAMETSLEEIFTKGKGKDMIDYLIRNSEGSHDLFCRHCMERNIDELHSWEHE